jgi:molybdopterin/thiamine biosynthesis adenylyltransferase
LAGRIVPSIGALPPAAPILTAQASSPADAHPSPDRERTYSTSTFDIRRLAGCEIVLLGAGSVGSFVAAALAAAGLVINVIDPGIVQSRHTTGGRTIYDPTQVGIKKVYALKDKAERQFPGVVINALPYNSAEIPGTQLKSLFTRSYAVVCAIDDPLEILRISDVAYPLTELVQPAMHAQGASGHVAVTIPFASACLRCVLGVQDAADIHRLDSEPASGLDIAMVAQQAARIVLDILYSKVTGQPITRWDTAKNLLYIANVKQDTSPEGPGLIWESSTKRPGCPTCSLGRIKEQ